MIEVWYGYRGALICRVLDEFYRALDDGTPTRSGT